MVSTQMFTDASHALNDLSHALALLECENTKLRKAEKSYLSVIHRLNNEINALKDENEKLKDAMQTTYDLFVTGKVRSCDLCDRLGECENHPAPSPCKYEFEEDALKDWLQEIGVEVNDA